MVNSMTGFASGQGEGAGFGWSWELRGVNSKGLDLRLRVPDWVPGLEQALRTRLAKAVLRGNVTLSLRLTRDESADAQSVNGAALHRLLKQITEVEEAARATGLTLGQTSALSVLNQRGILDASGDTQDTEALAAALRADFEPVLAGFVAMRATEGGALDQVLAEQLRRIETLTHAAATAAENRRPQVAETLRANLARVLDNTDGADETRVAQELAMLAVKADVTEEIDRLLAHIGAARDLLGAKGSIGRKLDFLMQEFNREANTLCSKSQNADLTAIGLDLKATIDQMREQVQNVE